MAWATVTLFLSQKTLAAMTCPVDPAATELYALIETSSAFSAVRFIKTEDTGAGVLAWRFIVSNPFTKARMERGEKVSFFAKIVHESKTNSKKNNNKNSKAKKAAKTPTDLFPKLNDRFLVFVKTNNRKIKDSDQPAQLDSANLIANALDNYFTKSRRINFDACVIESNVYLEDFLRQHIDLKATPDRACTIQMRPLESKPIIKDAIKFRCQNPKLERKRITLLAQSYANAGRYGNAITALELSHGSLNAATTLQSLEWIEKWQSKDAILTKRFSEKILSTKNRAHLVATGQSRAVDDVLNDPKKYEALRATDWFGPLVSQWLTNVTPAQ